LSIRRRHCLDNGRVYNLCVAVRRTYPTAHRRSVTPRRCELSLPILWQLLIFYSLSTSICDPVLSTRCDVNWLLISELITEHGSKMLQSTQPCIPSGSLNRVPASAGGKGGNVASAGWHVTLCDPIWQVSSSSGEAGLFTNSEPLYRVHFTYLLVAL